MTSQQIREKTSARKVLAVLVGLLASLLALEGLASVRAGGAFEVFAQATGTTPTVKIINPDETTSDVISARNDGENTHYDLVAWVSNPPVNAVVQFKYTPSGTNQPTFSIHCGNTGTQNAALVAPDTYECDWDLAGVNDGGGTLRAELYNEGAGKVAEDAEPVTIESAAETIEITYPRQGEAVGFYTGPDGIASGIIEVTTSTATADDQGPQQINVYYSMAPPGTEPVFELCGSEEIESGGRHSVRCDIGPDDTDTAQNEADPNRITAIAAIPVEVANGPLPADPVTGIDPDREETFGAADAHRALGYEQDPASVVLNPQTHQATAGTCSQIITAQVLDTNGRHIVGVNVDVHAAGPTDNLFFDDDDASGTPNNSSRHKAPENHETEPTANCEDTDPPPNFRGNQGVHARAAADIKHIESVDAGTNDNGEFKFQLYSIDVGSTQFTVWADEDGDDNFCDAEASGNGSIGWSQAPPIPTGVEPAQPCPTPTGTASPTATATATATATPTSTGTTSPTQSPTSTTTQAPTQCSDGQDNDGDGDVDMQDPGCDSPEDNDESDEQRNVVQNGPCAGFEQGSRQPKSDGSGVVIVGTPGPDDLRGGSGNDLICGLGGRDALRGRGGQDELYGGGGHDDIRGNAGNDYIEGNAGLDVLRGGRGADIVKGGAQDDTIRAYVGRDRLVGGPGNDTLRGGRHNDRLFGNLGDDFLGGGAGFDRCNPGPGDDTRNGCER